MKSRLQIQDLKQKKIKHFKNEPLQTKIATNAPNKIFGDAINKAIFISRQVNY